MKDCHPERSEGSSSPCNKSSQTIQTKVCHPERSEGSGSRCNENYQTINTKGQVRSWLSVKKTLTMMTSRETMPKSVLASRLTSALNCGVVSNWLHSKTISRLASIWGAFLSKQYLMKQVGFSDSDIP